MTFVPFDSLQDRVYIGRDNKMYEIYSGQQWKTQLMTQFPREHKALDEFFRLLNGAYDWHLAVFGLKLVPLWLVKMLFATGLIKVMTRSFETNGRTVKDVIENITENKDLREVLAFREVSYIVQNFLKIISITLGNLELT